MVKRAFFKACLLYTSDAADERSSVDLGGRRIIKKNKVITILMGDKKVRNGKMRFILPIELGKVDIFNDIDETQFLKYFD